MDVADRIRLARRQQGYTQKELAALLKVGQSAIAQWEGGLTRPDTQNRVKLSVLLRIPASELSPESKEISEALMKELYEALTKAPQAQQLLQHFFRLPPEQREAILATVAQLAAQNPSSD